MKAPFLINLDWLAFSVLLTTADPAEFGTDYWKPTFRPVEGYKIVEFGGTNIYKHRWCVFDNDGRKVCTLLACPHSRLIAFNSCLVEVANSLLYTGWDFIVEVLEKMHGYSFQSLSRVDICADFELTPQRADFVEDLHTMGIYVQGKREGSMFHEYDRQEHGTDRRVYRTPHCMSWGSKHSNIKWKLYDKSKEIHEWQGQTEVCTKPYILDRWRVEGWNVRNVWRLEVSITPAAKFEYLGHRLCLPDLFDRTMIEELFVANYRTRFVTRKNEGHKDRSNDTQVWLLGKMFYTERMPAAPARTALEVAEFVAPLRAAMHQLEEPANLACEDMRLLWVDTACKCVKLGHLEDYFLRTYGYSVEEINLHCSLSL